MKGLLLAPHNDDETLFAGHLVADLGLDVVVVLRSVVQGAAGAWQTRESESRRAVWQLRGEPAAGCFEQWAFSDARPYWQAIHAAIRGRVDDAGYTHLYAPAVEPDGGHDHHDQIGRIAERVAAELNVALIRYHTYVNGRSRTEGVHRVDPSPEAIRRKLLALACYESQHALWATAHHFIACQQEWTS